MRERIEKRVAIDRGTFARLLGAVLAVVLWLAGAVFATLAGPSSAARFTPSMTMPAAALPLPGIAPGPAAREPGHPQTQPPPARLVQFEPNLGQAAAAVRYVAHGPGVSADVREDGLVIRTRVATPATRHVAPAKPAGARASTVTMHFVGADRGGAFSPREPTGSRSNYLVGDDPSRWVKDVPRYQQLRYTGLYPGIDLVYYSRQGELEYDLVVHPNADPSPVRMQFSGAHKLRLDKQGDLLLDGHSGHLRLQRPLLYQHIDGEKKTLAGTYVLLASNQVALKLPAYDRSKPLVIDPTFKLLYSTYLGGVHDDQATAIALDTQRNAYVVGFSASEDFPISGNAYQRQRKNLRALVHNVVVSKFNASGKLIYSTFIGGSTNDYGQAIAVDDKGRAIVAGRTASADFPLTSNAFQSTFAGTQSAFLARLSPDGSALEYASYYGGHGGADAHAIALEANAVAIAGSAGPGLPTTAGAYKATLATGNAAFVAKFDLAASGAAQLLAASYYGVDNPQPNNLLSGNLAFALALDASGAAWLAGQAYTRNLPTTAGALLTAPAAMDSGCTNGVAALNSFAYVAKLSTDLKTLAFASYLSGQTKGPGLAACSEYAHAIKLDPAGNVYIGGATASASFPTTAGVAQPAYPGAGGVAGFVSFVSKLRPDGAAILWSSYLGGNAGNTFLSTLALDASQGAVWAAAVTAGGANFPLSADALQPVFGGGGFDASITRLDANAGTLGYSSFLGGGGLDNALAMVSDGAGNVVVGGVTRSTNFPVTPNALQPKLTPRAFDGGDWFISILGGGTVGALRPARGGNTGDVTISIEAAGVQPQARARLVGAAGNAIASTGVAVLEGDSGARFTFALRGAAAGDYDLVLDNPDGTTVTRKASFTVQAGPATPELSVDVSGRQKIRAGVPAQYQLTVSNNGNIDAYFAVVNLALPASAQTRFGFAPLPPAFPGDTTDYSQITGTVLDNGVAHTAIVFPIVPAGRSVSVPFETTMQGETSKVPVEATLYPCAVGSQEELRQVFGEGLGTLARERPQGVALPIGPDGRCALTIFSVVGGGLIAAAAAGPGAPVIGLVALGAAMGFLLGTIVNTAITPGGYALPALTLDGMKTLISTALPAWAANVWNGLDILNTCDPDGSRRVAAATFVIDVVNSLDPNDKTGPAGDGSPAHHIAGGRPLVYAIGFENVKSASAPAAQVVVTDQLDAGKLDLASLTLGAITIGRTTIPVPAGLDSFAATQPIDATMSVRIQGSLNPSTGVLKWSFDTLDPQTGLPPSDPTLGFLPPNADGVQGQGYVRFTVLPKAGQPHGTEFANAASIVFDVNAPIVTPVWLNTLDLSAPASKVESLVGQPGTTSFSVNWAATDSGSGAARYTVFVSDNGGPYTPWQSAVTNTSASYPGADGHRYDFHVVATDGAGNREGAKSATEATIAVNGPFPDATGSGGGGGGCTIGSGDRHDITLALLALLAALLLALRGAASSRRRAGG